MHKYKDLEAKAKVKDTGHRLEFLHSTKVNSTARQEDRQEDRQGRRDSISSTNSHSRLVISNDRDYAASVPTVRSCV
ncbi:hypothetical protein McaMca56_006918 [Microsporum canis]